MEIKYFTDTDTALVEFSDKEVNETVEITENILIDIDENGNIVNMTIEHAKATAKLPNIAFQEM